MIHSCLGVTRSVMGHLDIWLADTVVIEGSHLCMSFGVVAHANFLCAAGFAFADDEGASHSNPVLDLADCFHTGASAAHLLVWGIAQSPVRTCPGLWRLRVLSGCLY